MGTRTGRTTIEPGSLLALNGQAIALDATERVVGPRTWARNRYAALRAMLLADGWSAERVELQYPEIEERVARCFLAIFALESGWGAAEWDWNAAGILCVAPRRCIEGVTDDGAPLESFDGFAPFVRRFTETLSLARYSEARAILLDDRRNTADFYLALYPRHDGGAQGGYGSERAARELPEVEALAIRWLNLRAPSPTGGSVRGGGGGGGRAGTGRAGTIALALGAIYLLTK